MKIQIQIRTTKKHRTERASTKQPMKIKRARRLYSVRPDRGEIRRDRCEINRDGCESERAGVPHKI